MRSFLNKVGWYIRLIPLDVTKFLNVLEKWRPFQTFVLAVTHTYKWTLTPNLKLEFIIAPFVAFFF